MALRQLASRFILPNLEKDLSCSISRQLQQVHDMTDCMIAPTVHAFQARSAGFAGATAKQNQRRMVKVEYPVPGEGRGLFHG